MAPLRCRTGRMLCILGAAVAAGTWNASAQELAPPPRLLQTPSVGRTAGPLKAPALESGDRPLPINLPTALRLANVQAVDVVAAAERLNAAFAVLDQARAQWLPTITLGGDYYRHDGKIQNSDGSVTDNSHSSWMYGAGSGIGAAAILSPDDAIFGALIAKQTVRARQADLQAAHNDTLVAVTDAYFNVQQARGELAGAMDARRRAEELVRRTKELQSVSGLAPGLEVVRAQAEVARRQQTELQAREQWQLSSADLLRRLAPRPRRPRRAGGAAAPAHRRGPAGQVRGRPDRGCTAQSPRIGLAKSSG